MNAITYCDYGTSEVLRLEPVEKPVAADDQVLVRVRAASVNPLDWHYMRGTPYFMRLDAGLRKPAVTRLGVDFAGTVEAVGRSVTTLKPGDEVFGTRNGAFAEYVAVRAERVATKPAAMTFEQAASIPVAAVTALQAVRDKGHLQSGEKLLINGASGGVGTFMVQIAKTLGAQVTGVCSTRNLEMVRSLGADHVIDYTQEDFSKRDERYDLIVDNVGNRSLSDFRRVLAPKGRYVLVGGGGPNDGRVIGPLGKVLYALVLSWFVPQQMGMMLADTNKEDLGILAGLIESGKVTPVIDRRYPLSEVPEAITYLETGRARGKVIITIDE
ncbi:MAG TPA: NAD(P)-dependent alcohol dehydrogenase [Candidatus Polarisedimenticolia bacterium]|nr:NAD(P)-dependent alcohol dehydrogenase [Candidatus Polarisedimenticolia bacterium]